MTDDTNSATLEANEPATATENTATENTVTETTGNGQNVDEQNVLEQILEGFQKEMETMKAQADEYKDKFMRAQADLQTYRRRVQGDIDRARDAGLESALLPVMTVYDDLGRALMMSTDPEKLIPGIQSVREGLERNLDMLGIKKVGEKGEMFNPELHEALTTVPVTEGAEAGTIANVFEVGFMKGEKLVRPAKVVVYQGD
jgi:molecular chaperone GrpE